MNTNSELNYKLHLHREEDFVRTDISNEFSRYNDIKFGNVEKVAENFRQIKANYYEGKGVLSDDPVRNVIYHFVVSVAIIARVCVDGGLPHDESYTLSDIYIRRADKCKAPEEVIELLGEMHIDYATRMKNTKKANTISYHVRHAIDYINDHLNVALTMEKLASIEGLSQSYFSKLFAKETGTTVKAYILNIKIKTAQNILVNTTYPLSDISLSLGFSSQSAFSTAFKRLTGITPGEYRNTYNNSPVNGFV